MFVTHKGPTFKDSLYLYIPGCPFQISRLFTILSPLGLLSISMIVIIILVISIPRNKIYS
jgi:hypothetical protein